MEETERKKYLLENKHSHGDDFSPVIHLGERNPDTKLYKVLDYVDEKTGDIFYKLKVATRPRRKLTVKEVAVFVSILVIFVGINYFLFSFVFSFKKEYPSVLNFGDMMFDRGVRNIMENKKRDPFEYIKADKDILAKYDVVIANLEGPIVVMDRASCQQKIYNFQFGKDTPQRIKDAGIKMVNLANNHTYDCLNVGFQSTKEYLDKAGIDHIGDIELEKSYIVKTIDNKKIAFIGMDQTVQQIPITRFYNLVKKLKSENDYVVVNIHWGTEYLLTADNNQKEIGHKLIDNGADVVFGSHPHVVEPAEVYKAGLIFYSLGNFVFDQDFGDTTVGLGVGVEFQKKRMVVTLYPINIKKFAPQIMKGADLASFCAKYLKDLETNSCSFEIVTNK